MGTNCAPLVADLFLFCYERDFMKYLSNDNTPVSDLTYLASPRTISHGCQIVHWDLLNAKQSCPQKCFGMGYVKMHCFHGNP